MQNLFGSYFIMFVHNLLPLHLWVLLDELDTLLDVLLQVNQACIQQLLLVVGKLTNIVNLLNTIWTKGNLGGEEVDTLVLVERAVNESWLDNVALTIGSSEDALSETGTSHGHGQSS